jgi:hypothetical protein
LLSTRSAPGTSAPEVALPNTRSNVPQVCLKCKPTRFAPAFSDFGAGQVTRSQDDSKDTTHPASFEYFW